MPSATTAPIIGSVNHALPRRSGGAGILNGCVSARAWPRSPARRPAGADEGAHEFSLDVGRDGLDVEAGSAQELTRVLRAVDACRLDLDRLKPGLAELRPI